MFVVVVDPALNGKFHFCQTQFGLKDPPPSDIMEGVIFDSIFVTQYFITFLTLYCYRAFVTRDIYRSHAKIYTNISEIEQDIEI